MSYSVLDMFLSIVGNQFDKKFKLEWSDLYIYFLKAVTDLCCCFAFSTGRHGYIFSKDQLS